MPEPLSTPSSDDQHEGITLESLESDDSSLPIVESQAVSSQVDDSVKLGVSDHANLSPHDSWLKRWQEHFNIYALFFILVLLLAAIVTAIAYFQNQKTPASDQLTAQNLSQSALEKVASSDANVGNNSQVLNVQSSAVFANKVLVRKDLAVAGNLQIGGTVGLTNLGVAGTSQFGQVQVNKDLAVAGNTGIQGSLTVAKGLQVNGNGNFSGAVSAPQLTAGTLQLNGDLVLSHHIKTTGAAPARTAGTALGSGGTVSISGSDTSGTVAINTGSSPAAGCFVTITFASRYSSTPRVLVTPVGAASGSLGYYVNRTSSNFSICDINPPPGGSSFGFDYFVVE